VAQSNSSAGGTPPSGFHAALRSFSAAIESELQNRELSFPTVLDLSLRVRKVASDPDSTVEELAKLIRLEPVLSARAIRMANSVIYNRAGRRITSVADAITRIGISNIRVLALIVAMDQLAQEHRSKPMRELAKGVWRHSVDIGAWAYALSRHLRVGSPDTSLLVGLMTDIGQLYLIGRVGQYPVIATDLDAFAEIAGFWSDALSRAILERMDLPSEMMDALDYFDPYEGDWPPSTPQQVLYIAGLATESPLPQRGNEAWQRQRDATRESIGADRFDALLAAAAPMREDLLAALRE